jgi:hypothetical protein
MGQPEPMAPGIEIVQETLGFVESSLPSPEIGQGNLRHACLHRPGRRDLHLLDEFSLRLIPSSPPDQNGPVLPAPRAEWFGQAPIGQLVRLTVPLGCPVQIPDPQASGHQ